MKSYIKIFIIISFLSIINSTCSMEEREESEKQEQKETETQKVSMHEIPQIFNSLPIEIWDIILKQIYFDIQILDEARDIYECIDIIEKYIPQSYLAIALVCKAFNALSISKDQWIKFEKEIREFYINYINSRFLERREGKEGLYPKNEKWHNDDTMNNNIAQFIELRKTENTLLLDIIEFTVFDKEIPAEDLKLIHLLLFYGADPNLSDSNGSRALSTLADRQFLINEKFNYTETIKTLLKYGANPNLQDDSDRGYALYFASCANATDKNAIEIINCLLRYGANPNLKNDDGEVSFDAAMKAYRTFNNTNSTILTTLVKHGG